MVGYLIRRVLHGILVVFGVTVITFLIPASLHANIARILLYPRATKAGIDALNAQYHFNAPIWTQYYYYMDGLVHGNLGISFSKETFHQTVTSMVGPAIWETLWIILISLVISLIIAIPLGLAQAMKRNTSFDYVATGGIFILYSTPVFVLGTILLTFFAAKWHVFPYAPHISNRTGAFGRLFDIFQFPMSYILPILTLTALTVGGFSRFMRGSVLDTLVQDYIRTAKAKGASSRRVLYRHAFRNAIIPIVTLLGLSLPALFAGAVITEHLFNLSGMGTVTVTAVGGPDIPVIMAATLLVAIATVIGNFLADVGVAAIDPRIRLTGTR